MTPAPAPELGQLDAWVLSTYQRLERLDVPVFAVGGAPMRPLGRRVDAVELRALSTDLPRSLPAAGLSDERRLSLLLRYLAAPHRYEPLGESPIHKTVPSARCLFPLSWFVLQRRDGVTRAFAHAADWHALLEVAWTGAPLAAEGDVALACVARVWSIAEKYGDFADFPCVLEAGHAFAQLGHLAAALELGGAPLDRALARPLCAGEFELPLYAAALDLPALDLSGLPGRTVRLSQPCEVPDLRERFPTLGRMHRLFDTGATASAKADAVAPPVDLLAAMRRRTAGNDRSGLAAAMAAVPAGLMAELLGRWRALGTARARLAAEDELRFAVAWLAKGPTPIGLYDAEGARRSPELGGAAFVDRLQRMLPYSGMRYNLSTLVLTLIIQVDARATIDRLGGAALRDIHLAAGAAAQDFSLAAAASGMFARPVRMMREAALEAALPLDGQVVYQLLCGFARRSNPTMELM